MRTIKRTAKFKKDYKREAKGQHRLTLDRDLLAVVRLLAADEALMARYRDHALTGMWNDHRDCHIKPDLVLIYRKLEGDILELVRLGTHSELSLGPERPPPERRRRIAVRDLRWPPSR